jgi:signal transduction histidine kinase
VAWLRGVVWPSLPPPARWPVRWRLTAVSSLLTFVILIVFAAVVGRLAEQRLQSDFRNEVAATASDLATRLGVECKVDPSGLSCHGVQKVDELPLPSSSELRIIFNGGVVEQTPGAAALGDLSPKPRSASYEVAVREVQVINFVGRAYLQYGRDKAVVERTINRVWLFLGAGVLGGTVLALLAGLAVASRAMRPIAALTRAARRIASTRDPSLSMPRPETDDEIAELARTLDEMLGELDQARSETEQMVQAQREFVADASHELRTPLTSILANLELLEEALARRQGGGGEESEMVASALRSSKRMRRLVGDLLLLARADAGRTTQRAELELADVVEAAYAEVKPVADDHELVLRRLDSARVIGNADELHRLVVNLLDNGIKHTPAGTRIELELARSNGTAVLEVTDDGPGLPDGMEEQVFSRFVRGAGPSDIAGDGGTGLGLAIVRAVAQSHGGGVTAGRSEAGGARFVVTLPALGGEREGSAREISANL